MNKDICVVDGIRRTDNVGTVTLNNNHKPACLADEMVRAHGVITEAGFVEYVYKKQIGGTIDSLTGEVKPIYQNGNRHNSHGGYQG